MDARNYAVLGYLETLEAAGGKLTPEQVEAIEAQRAAFD